MKIDQLYPWKPVLGTDWSMMDKARNTRLWNVSTNRPWNAAKSYEIVDYDVEFSLSTLRKALRILSIYCTSFWIVPFNLVIICLSNQLPVTFFLTEPLSETAFRYD